MRLLSVPEVAKLLSVTPGRVYELVRLRLLPAVHLGRQIRVEEQTLREWIRNGGCSLPRAS
jgi:excisionase family DNA binding protein